MKYKIEILRRKSKDSEPYRQSFDYETDDGGATLASALLDINKTIDDKIMWECSCLQKKCGACAMVINGRPGLACDFKLENAKDGKVVAEPLKKFPPVADLVVDRSVMFENLKEMKSWLTSGAQADEKENDLLYDASRCLQCGCCLEICPNFYSGGKFFGTASMIPVSRLLEELPESEKKELRKKYTDHFFSGCGKSFACRNVCPAGIDVDRLFVNSNAASLWKYLFRR